MSSDGDISPMTFRSHLFCFLIKAAKPSSLHYSSNMSLNVEEFIAANQRYAEKFDKGHLPIPPSKKLTIGEWSTFTQVSVPRFRPAASNLPGCPLRVRSPLFSLHYAAHIICFIVQPSILVSTKVMRM